MRFIHLAKSHKLLWYGLLAIVVSIDIATLIEYGRLNFLRIICILVAVTAASLIAIISGVLLNWWQWRTQKIPLGLQRRKLMLAWCRGVLHGGLLGLLLMPLLIYEEFDGPGILISVIRVMQGCRVGTCVFGEAYMFAPMMVLSVVPFILSLIITIISARRSWNKCI